MIQINQLKLPVGHGPEALKKKAAQMLKVQEKDLMSVTVKRQSLDARKKPQLFYVYTVEVEVNEEKTFPKSQGKKGRSIYRNKIL